MPSSLPRLALFFCVSAALFVNCDGYAQDAAVGSDASELWCEYEGGEGPGNGKHIVLIAGDDEYRSEEALPMLGKILSQHYGFRCTVLFPIDPESGEIKPDLQTNIPGMHFLDEADLVILGLRFRNLPDEDMAHFVSYVESGKPIIGTRTSTHAFRIPEDRKFHRYSFNARKWRGGFGQQILGDTWVNHHGNHRVESTRGQIETGKESHAILRGVTDVWGPTDVYGIVHLPADANVLMRGQVLKGMRPDDEPVSNSKNEPMMPVAWTRELTNSNGKTARVFNTTMGASQDFESAHLRRLVVNAAFWCLEMEDKIPEFTNVRIVDSYMPTPFGFGSFKKGMRPADYAMAK